MSKLPIYKVENYDIIRFGPFWGLSDFTNHPLHKALAKVYNIFLKESLIFADEGEEREEFSDRVDDRTCAYSAGAWRG